MEQAIPRLQPHALFSFFSFVQVDVVVELKSDSGAFEYVGPELKVRRRCSESYAIPDAVSRGLFVFTACL